VLPLRDGQPEVGYHPAIPALRTAMREEEVLVVGSAPGAHGYSSEARLPRPLCQCGAEIEAFRAGNRAASDFVDDFRSNLITGTANANTTMH